MYVIPIAAFCTAYYLVNVVLWHVPLKRAFKRQRVKPFDCVQCLSVWFALGLYFLPIELSNALALIFGAGFISTRIK
jgi:hypothetical protein